MLVSEKTAFEQRFEAAYQGPLIPLGAEVIYVPHSPADKERLPKYNPKRLEGVFLGYEQVHGGGWTKRVFVLNLEKLEQKEGQ